VPLAVPGITQSADFQQLFLFSTVNSTATATALATVNSTVFKDLLQRSKYSLKRYIIFLYVFLKAIDKSYYLCRLVTVIDGYVLIITDYFKNRRSTAPLQMPLEPL